MQEFRKSRPWRLRRVRSLRSPLLPRVRSLRRQPSLLINSVLKPQRERGVRRSKSLNYYDLRYPKPVYSPRFRSKFSKSREKIRCYQFLDKYQNKFLNIEEIETDQAGTQCTLRKNNFQVVSNDKRLIKAILI